ncbi:hypothetical protein ACPXCE_00640 [Streptomyces sp. DT24]|uniref:hypothetical protein n=1 Tax=unclassified Streptomyces TaxID=2593676 RepID=UPI0023B8C47A|nr:hypothetical protein [Streptomyces sp. AM 4-1-1]WEH36527.1 hypothetical protein PZB75_26145 [Streptomyces sp. AM 4-1-1]
MKYAKTAALVAGSLVALGTAAPAFAVTDATAPNFSLDGGIQQVLTRAPQGIDPVVGTVAKAAETAKKDGTVGRLAGEATGVAKSAAPLLGGVALGR